MLRLVALVLLLANGLLLASHWGWFERLGATGSGDVRPGGAAQREPERLTRQVNPQAVTILSPQAASAALGAAAASAAQAAQAAAAVCLEAGPFGAAEADTAERTLRDAGLAAGSWQAIKTEDRGAFMVYMGRYADRETLQAKQEQLRRMKVDAEDLRNTPELQPGLSLGRFDNKPAADAALARLLQRGVRTAKVITQRPAQQLTLLRLPAADAPARARLAGLRLPSGPGFVACAAPAEAAASATPVAPPASTGVGAAPPAKASATPTSAAPGQASKPTPAASAPPVGASAKR
jgi:hypothetical protein